MTPMPGGAEAERNGRTCTANGMFGLHLRSAPLTGNQKAPIDGDDPRHYLGE